MTLHLCWLLFYVFFACDCAALVDTHKISYQMGKPTFKVLSDQLIISNSDLKEFLVGIKVFI